MKTNLRHIVKYDPSKHHRKSIRLKGYDYTHPGGYFVTIVTLWRECMFGKIVDGVMQLNELGQIIWECWEEIPAHFPNTDVNEFVVMPNHVHGILFIHEGNGTPICPACVGAQHAAPLRGMKINVKSGSLGAIIRSFKSAVTRRAGRELNSANIWQRNYYEHIIRNNADWERICNYIAANPLNWVEDEENPINIR